MSTVPHTRTRAPKLEYLEERLALTLLGQQLFPADNPWNQLITKAPVAANSAAIMNNILSHYGNGRLHPDFSQDFHDGRDLYGIPFNIVHGSSQPFVHVDLSDGYPDESDPIDAPIPLDARIEGDYQNGPKVGVDERGDSHLLVYDVDNNVAYEFYRASRPSENGDGQWHADQESVWDMKTNTFRTLGYTSADAAGLSLLAGLARPDEGLPVSQGGQGVINHAIRFTLRNSLVLDKYLYPASHHANPGNHSGNEPAMGARFRLKASVDISHLSPQSRVIAQAMKDYGLILADNGSNFFFSGASSSVDASNGVTLTWDDDDIQDSLTGLKSLKYSDFEVVDLRPVVTGLSAHVSPAGTTVTVVGKNFSGAAGQLQVFFGTAAATNVTYVDDRHITAVVPAGTGRVHVRVQSGATTTENPFNVNNTIFGYGLSKTSSNDLFTYGPARPNAAPTVRKAAYASPATVGGTSTVLHVVGADDGGASHLSYVWTALNVPSGASPVIGTYGNNEVRDVRATFDRAGDYVFQVTITDEAGLTATSQVAVHVNQTVKSVHVTPDQTSVARGGQQQFSATAFDQFGDALVVQPTFAWRLSSVFGLVDATGLYTAPTSRTGMVRVRAISHGIVGSALVTVT